MSSRGITDIMLNGEAFELHPTFSNLDKLETVLNKGAIGFLRQDLSSGAFKMAMLFLSSRCVPCLPMAANSLIGGIVTAWARR